MNSKSKEIKNELHFATLRSLPFQAKIMHLIIFGFWYCKQMIKQFFIDIKNMSMKNTSVNMGRFSGKILQNTF